MPCFHQKNCDALFRVSLALELEVEFVIGWRWITTFGCVNGVRIGDLELDAVLITTTSNQN
jgi:hypothetical protein